MSVKCKDCVHYRDDDALHVYFSGCFHPDNVRLIDSYYSNKDNQGNIATGVGNSYELNRDGDCSKFKKKRFYQSTSRNKPHYKGEVPTKPYCSGCKHYHEEPYGMFHAAEVCNACVEDGEVVNLLDWLSDFTFEGKAKNPNHPKNRNADNKCSNFQPGEQS